MPILIGQKLESDFSNPLGLLSDCHRRIERFLALLIEVAGQAKGSKLDEEKREALEKALRYFREAAPLHTLDEEESLFPRLRASGGARAEAVLARLESLHEEHIVAQARHGEVETLGRRWLTEGLLTAEESQRMAELLEDLHVIYQRHIRLEDTEIFPLAEKMLDDEELKVIAREMAARRGLAPTSVG